MYRSTGLILVYCFLFVFSGFAQDSSGYNPYVQDTSAFQNVGFVDTVKHIYGNDALKSTKTVVDKKALAEKKAQESENDKIWIKQQIAAMTMRIMRGRGYVKGGMDTAGIFVMKRFKELKLKPLLKNGNYAQGFAYPVISYPKKINLVVNGDTLKPGLDYLVNPSSQPIIGKDLKGSVIELNDVKDRDLWKKLVAGIDSSHVYYLLHTDSFCKNVLHISMELFISLLPRGVYLIPQEGRLQWSVSRDTISATLFYVHENALPRNIKYVDITLPALFNPKFRTQNIIGYVPGEVADSYVIFTAHYDHLGMMGDTTIFPGGNEGASGIAELFYIASHVAKKKPHYSTVFIAFSGEEAGLMGSEFYVKYPAAPLKRTKMVVNLNLIGDATYGFSVINGLDRPNEFALLQQINDREKYVPKLRAKGPATNGSHYHFTKSGVPAFFIYGNGTSGYYHDIYDKAKSLSAAYMDGLGKLLIDFANSLR